MGHDLLIRNGTIVDGTGSAGFVGDVAISGGRITAVGKVDGRRIEHADDGAGKEYVRCRHHGGPI